MCLRVLSEVLSQACSDSHQLLILYFILQDLKANTQQQAELLREQATLKEEIREYLRKRKDCQERQKKRENHLQQLQGEIEEKEAERARQEAVRALLTSLAFS